MSVPRSYSRGCGGDSHRRAKAQWTKGGACGKHCRRHHQERSMDLGQAARDAFFETRVLRVSQKYFNTVGQGGRFEDVWREWVKQVSKLPQGSLSSQAIEQLTISGLSRHGQPELENHLRLRAPMTWQHVQHQVEHIFPQSTINSHHNRWTRIIAKEYGR